MTTRRPSRASRSATDTLSAHFLLSWRAAVRLPSFRLLAAAAVLLSAAAPWLTTWFFFPTRTALTDALVSVGTLAGLGFGLLVAPVAAARTAAAAVPPLGRLLPVRPLPFVLGRFLGLYLPCCLLLLLPALAGAMHAPGGGLAAHSLLQGALLRLALLAAMLLTAALVAAQFVPAPGPVLASTAAWFLAAHTLDSVRGHLTLDWASRLLLTPLPTLRPFQPPQPGDPWWPPLWLAAYSLVYAAAHLLVACERARRVIGAPP